MRAWRRARPGWWPLALVVPAALLAACGSGGSSPGTPASPAAVSAAVSPPEGVLCADAAALRASLDKLRHVKVSAGAAGEITAGLNEVAAKLTTLVNDARGQWHAQTSALKSALGTLKSAAQNLAATPTSGAVTGVAAALGGVGAAAGGLLASIDTRCLSASPSPGT